MEDSLISVIIPCYNAQEHLHQCLNSVLGQESVGIEVICVDDGSSDCTPDILRSYAEQDSRVTVICQENKFAGVARNRGLDAAKGKYVAFMDSDDFYLPGALHSLLQAAEKYDADVIKGSFCYLDITDQNCYLNCYSTNSCVPKNRRLSFQNMPERLLNTTDVPWNGLYRRSFLTENGIRFNALRCVNDHSFYIHCLLLAQHVCYIDRVVSCYRVEQAGSLIGKKGEHFECQLESYKIVWALSREEPERVRKTILQQELTGVFGWYVSLREKHAEKIEPQLRSFLMEHDMQDVGADFLTRFPYCREYHELRFGNGAPGHRPAAPVRMFECWKEHGWKYTAGRLFKKEWIKRYDLDRND